MTTQSRNSDAGINDMDTHVSVDVIGVGGRREHDPSPRRGGGYLDVCTKNAGAFYEKMLTDKRISDLRRHGLADIWIEIAERIGYDAFLQMWQILDKKNIDAGICDNNRIRVPVFSRFIKFQRNKYICQLDALGKSPKTIKHIIKTELSENLSTTHIYRILVKAKLK